MPHPPNNDDSQKPWRAGLRAAHANRYPGLALVAFALTLLLSYWFLPPARNALQSVASLKDQTGFAFALLSTPLFGGLIPWLVQRTLRPTHRDAQFPVLLFLTGFWAIKGLEVDLLYRGQAALFGDDPAPLTVALKVLLDQFVYVPLWAVPSTLAAYAWRDVGFSPTRLYKRLTTPGWFGQEFIPLLISNWLIWVPAVVVIYLLPLPLQLPIQNLVLCFWSLMLIIQTRRASDVTSGGV